MRTLHTITGLFLVCAFLAACSSGRPGEPAPLRGVGLPQQAASAAVNDTPLGRAVLQAINGYRTVAPLSVNATLQRAAAVHAQDMAMRNYGGHHNPEGQGPVDRVHAVDDKYSSRISENIWVGELAPGLSDAQIASQVLTKWTNSPQHRTILESARNVRTGIGVARKGNVTYVVAVFSD
jgi:uncharacterized protein YkwD